MAELQHEVKSSDSLKPVNTQQTHSDESKYN